MFIVFVEMLQAMNNPIQSFLKEKYMKKVNLMINNIQLKQIKELNYLFLNLLIDNYYYTLLINFDNLLVLE